MKKQLHHLASYFALFAAVGYLVLEQTLPDYLVTYTFVCLPIGFYLIFLGVFQYLKDRN